MILICVALYKKNSDKFCSCYDLRGVEYFFKKNLCDIKNEYRELLVRVRDGPVLSI